MFFFLNGCKVEVTECGSPRLLLKRAAGGRVHDDRSVWIAFPKLNTAGKEHSSVSDLNA